MFDEKYRTNTNYWGDEPTPAVRDYAPYFHHDTVLDIGAGDGRNTLYLASLGFHVTALDIATTGLRNLMKKARDQGLDTMVTTIAADFVDYETSDQYDNIVTNFTIHFAGSANVEPFLEKMTATTAPGGIDVIDDFTQNGPLAAQNPENYITPEFLQDFYQNKGWEVLQNHVRTVRTKALGADGQPYEHEAVEFVARKPRS